MAKEPKELSEETEGKKGPLAIFENKAVLLGVIVVVQALVAIGLTQFLIVPKLGVQGADVAAQQELQETRGNMPEMGVLVGLEDIIVSLDSPGPRTRYLRVNINLEVKDAMVAQVVTSRLPQLRDMVIMACSGKTPEELTTPEGKKGLRDEIFRRIDEKMPEGTLMNIYFSDLVVQ
jgi:flagellar FliL protein